MPNPLDSIVSNTSKSGGSSDFKVPPLPSLDEMIQLNGLREGAKLFDSKMETWRQMLERNIKGKLGG